MENSDKALIILLVSAVSFFSFYAVVILLGLKNLFTALNIAFFVFVIIIVVFMYAKGSRAFKFIKLHPYITIFILIGLAITSVNTGLYSFIDNEIGIEYRDGLFPNKRYACGWGVVSVIVCRVFYLQKFLAV